MNSAVAVMEPQVVEAVEELEVEQPEPAEVEALVVEEGTAEDEVPIEDSPPPGVDAYVWRNAVRLARLGITLEYLTRRKKWTEVCHVDAELWLGDVCFMVTKCDQKQATLGTRPGESWVDEVRVGGRYEVEQHWFMITSMKYDPEGKNNVATIVPTIAPPEERRGWFQIPLDEAQEEEPGGLPEDEEEAVAKHLAAEALAFDLEMNIDDMDLPEIYEALVARGYRWEPDPGEWALAEQLPDPSPEMEMAAMVAEESVDPSQLWTYGTSQAYQKGLQDMSSTLNQLIEDGAVSITNIVVRMSRTRSNGNFGNDKYEASLNAEVSEDADYNAVLTALQQRLRDELDLQERITEYSDKLQRWLYAQRAPVELRAKRTEVEHNEYLSDLERARLWSLIDEKLVDAEERQQREEARRAAGESLVYDEEMDPDEIGW